MTSSYRRHRRAEDVVVSHQEKMISRGEKRKCIYASPCSNRPRSRYCGYSSTRNRAVGLVGEVPHGGYDEKYSRDDLTNRRD
jgi:hypothetical protein